MAPGDRADLQQHLARLDVSDPVVEYFRTWSASRGDPAMARIYAALSQLHYGRRVNGVRALQRWLETTAVGSDSADLALRYLVLSCLATEEVPVAPRAAFQTSMLAAVRRGGDLRGFVEIVLGAPYRAPLQREITGVVRQCAASGMPPDARALPASLGTAARLRRAVVARRGRLQGGGGD